MNFKEIIKEEWKKEFPYEGVQGSPEETESYEYVYENSLFTTYENIVKRICVRVWNSAIETAENNAMIEEHVTEEYDEEKGDITVTNKEVYSGGYIRDENFVCVNPESILKLLINEQRTDTTQI
jgi:hypothetical protein